ncbi:NEQ191 [Nanoarchaeum equitans Kin4-M]|uniref:Peroxiredoxin n=1 Tax=Nanoarchaeum equitans (strain Kin4-M) TaxID=228908 RepID=TDXH_NANEQ|nr:RecName: Full=Peroxiredoxin; AltName: Full=Thioredoxin peroxidase; AltName: Full=Thioredoxin-dependent peroxiredoxin [Nanoarchaeum equitans Kin4-M]AAR39045.1 NEQ191 [Nanoarchaeum equitans Kin4-M]
MVVLGQKFPEVEVQTTHGRMRLPDHYRGKWFVLFSHPADFTPVCTTEFVEFARNYDKFKAMNTELIGLSIDQVFSHIKWIEWIKEKFNVEIPFPVIADDQGELARMLGMISPYKGTNTVRAVFIVDPEGYIRAMLYYPQETGRNIPEILRLVEALQTADKYGVATPANWHVDRYEFKPSSIVGNDVIIPPASSLEEKKDREERAKKGEIECFDWWFCHKKLE